MHASIVVLSTVAPSALAKTIPVMVGQTGLVFSPDSITAAVGDVVEFHFFGNFHTVVQGDYSTPCAMGSLKGTGFNSGPINNMADGTPNVFQVTIKTTDPMWYYCSVPEHCQSGMTGVINPPASGDTLATYRTNAHTTTTSEGSSTVEGGVVVAAGSSGGSASGSSATVPTTSPSSTVPGTTSTMSSSSAAMVATTSTSASPNSSSSASASSAVLTSSAASVASSIASAASSAATTKPTASPTSAAGIPRGTLGGCGKALFGLAFSVGVAALFMV